MRKNEGHYLREILRYVGDVRSYVDGVDFARFQGDDEKYDACCLKIGLIGEAASKLRAMGYEIPGIPYAEMAAMRNVIFHDYGGVDESTVWKTIQSDLPELAKKVSEEISRLG